MALKKKVVVAGSGYAGRAAAMLLDSEFDVTIIDPRDKLVHKILLRAPVRPEWVDCMLIPNDNIIKHGKRITASIKKVDFEKRSVTLSSEKVIPYDYLILATGALSKAPVEPPTGAAPHEFFNNVASKIAHAKNILIVGGGPIGIELSGEIKAKHPSIHVTIASNTPTLCANMGFPADASDKLVNTLKSVGVDVVLNHPIDLGAHSNESTIAHQPAKDYSSSLKGIDLVINCTGSIPNTKFLPSNLVNERGQIKVNEFLQVKDNVFSIGDCNDVKEPKNFTSCGSKTFMDGFPPGQADVVAENVANLAHGKPLAAYTPNSHVSGLIPIGPNASVSVGMPDAYGQYKAASYFYENQFKYVGASPPPKPAL